MTVARTIEQRLSVWLCRLIGHRYRTGMTWDSAEHGGRVHRLECTRCGSIYMENGTIWFR
jgi:hypothetical protein